MPDNELLPALAELIRLHCATTQCEWICPEGPDPEIIIYDGTWITNQICSGAGDAGNEGQENGRFIAAAHNLLPAVAQQVRELVAENERLRELLKGCKQNEKDFTAGYWTDAEIDAALEKETAP